MKKLPEHRILTKEIVVPALKDMFVKLRFKHMKSNIVMLTVEIGAILTLVLSIFPNIISEPTPRWFNFTIFIILFCTVLFANFAEAIAEGRGKAQANFLKSLSKTLTAKKIINLETLSYEVVDATLVKKGDYIYAEAGDIIALDGEIIQGIASIDESAITGESRPVTKEAGEDTSSVTGGTKVVSDHVIIKVNVGPGESFLDKMIALVENAERKKTPNEIALNVILIGLTIVFFVVIITLIPITLALGINIPLPILISLFVCLIPTTIGALLSAIGIAGMNHVTEFNVVAMSGKAVELCGDVTAIILDKTGTITYGTRKPFKFIPLHDVDEVELWNAAYLTSLDDTTPEGKAVLRKSEKLLGAKKASLEEYDFIKFSAATKMSGINAQNESYRKGSTKAILEYCNCDDENIINEVMEITNNISAEAGTPLVVCKNSTILGAIYLKDTIKPGLVSRFDELKEMGIMTIMCTGDNLLTAKAIAEEAHVDDFVAECSPEDKIKEIRKLHDMGHIVAMTGDGTNDAPALAIADIGIAMNSGTTAAKEAANMVDLDSDPTKIIDIIDIGKELLITRGALTTFSIANDIAKYFAIIPAIFATALPNIEVFNIMKLSSPYSAVISAVLFNALIIPLLIPIAIKGVKYRAKSSKWLLTRNLLIFGVGGILAPFIGIKLIDMIIYPILLVLFA